MTALTWWKTGSLVDHLASCGLQHPGTASWIWTLGAERVWCCAAFMLLGFCHPVSVGDHIWSGVLQWAFGRFLPHWKTPEVTPGLRLCSWRWFFRSGFLRAVSGRSQGVQQKQCGKSNDNIVDLQFGWFLKAISGKTWKTRDGLLLGLPHQSACNDLVSRKVKIAESAQELSAERVELSGRFHRGQMQKPFEDAAFALEVNEMSPGAQVKWRCDPATAPSATVQKSAEVMWWWPTVACISSWGLNEAYREAETRPGAESFWTSNPKIGERHGNCDELHMAQKSLTLKIGGLNTEDCQFCWSMRNPNLAMCMDESNTISLGIYLHKAWGRD